MVIMYLSFFFFCFSAREEAPRQKYIRVIHNEKFGKPDVLEIVNMPLPEPWPKEVSFPFLFFIFECLFESHNPIVIDSLLISTQFDQQ